VPSIDVKLSLKPGSQNINSAEIEALKRSPGVQQDLHRRADNVAAYQRAHVGVKTGTLIGTIRVESAGDSVDITAGQAGLTPQLGYQIYGTSPHEIRARGNGMLRFFWEKVGANVAFRKVSHPGTKRNPFVQESLRAAAD
jgi:hypothetical protein